MPRFVYASPVRPGKSAVIRQVYAKKRTQGDFEPGDKPFWEPLEMTGWNCWLQIDKPHNWFIHCLEGRSLVSIFAGLRQQIAKGDAYALWLRQFYLEVLGKDYKDLGIEPQLTRIFDFETGIQGDLVGRGFVLPLLTGQASSQVEYCQMCMYDPEYKDVLCHFGIARLTKFLQQTPAGELLIVYQEIEREKLSQLTVLSQQSAHHPAWLRTEAQMIADTGKPWRAPELEYLTDKLLCPSPCQKTVLR